MIRKKHLLFTALIFLSILFQMPLYGQNAERVQLNLKESTIQQVIHEIENQTNYRFVYDETIPMNGNVTVQLNNVPITTALNQVFKAKGISYEIIDNQIVLHEVGNTKQLSTGSISGKITDSEGQPLIGVTIAVKNDLSKGTVTDFDGNFVLSGISKNTLISVSYIGYQTVELPSNSPQFSNLVLQEDNKLLEEVVVVGYGTMKKKDLMGAASVLSGNNLTTNSNISVGGALQGKMSGINVMSSSGFPGGESNISIRGIGTFGSGDNSPLIVIDGSPITSGLEMLNPNDIESVNVLKDASSAAIYGSRAANGVILITTKKGMDGKATISFNANYGIQSPSNIPDLLTANEFVSAILEMRDNKKYIDGGNPTTRYDGVDPSSFGTGTRWSDYIYQSAPTYDINVNVSGGSSDVKYYLSGEYLNQEGIGITTAFKKATLRANLEGKINSFMKVGNNFQVFYSESLGDRSNRLSDVIFNAPIIPAYEADGSYGKPDPKYTSSKNAIPEVAWRSPKNNNYRLLDNLFVELNFTDYLKFRFNGGIDVGFNEYSLFSPIFNAGGQTNNTNSYADNRRKDLMWVTDYLLYFDKVFDNKHTVNAMGGISRQLYSNDNLNATVKNFVSEVPNMQVIKGGTNDTDKSLSGSRSELALGSYFGRINYDYMGKYLFGFNVRADGSSRFKGENQWGVFPSFSGAWRISEEDFFDSKAISSFKLRASWGQLGNQSIGSWYPTIASVVKKNVTFGSSGNDQNLYSGYTQTSLPNRTLHWETTTVTNAGIDLNLLNNSVQVIADYFYKSTDGILRSMVLPLNVGLTAPNVNYAQVVNTGVDFEVIYNGNISEFNYKIGANASYLHNEIKKLSSGVDFETITAPYGGLYINKVGEALSSMYGYRTGNVITTKEEADKQKAMGQGNAKIGRLSYVDNNNDGKINGDDRVILGSYIPKLSAGMTLSADWKGFDFTTVFAGVFGRKQFSPMSFQNRYPNRSQTRKWYDNRWTIGADPVGKYPAIIQGESYEEMTDLMVSNTSYVKIKSLTFGYRHNFKDFSSRVYISGENLLTISHKDFDGFDPENGLSPGHFTNWGGDYPTAKIFLIGLNLTF